MNNSYEFTYVTIHYQCGHSAIRPELRVQVGATERWSYDRCTHCTDLRERRYAINAAVQEERAEEVPA